MEDFPMFGICPECGSDSGDKAQASLGSADAGYAITTDVGSGTDVRTVANGYKVDTAKEGVPLYWHEGRTICKECVDRLTADSESLLSAHKFAKEESFRQRAGFVNEPE